MAYYSNHSNDTFKLVKLKSSVASAAGFDVLYKAAMRRIEHEQRSN